jgi:hypothetical protein
MLNEQWHGLTVVKIFVMKCRCFLVFALRLGNENGDLLAAGVPVTLTDGSPQSIELATIKQLLTTKLHSGPSAT